LKYLYLLFSDDDLVDLSQWVFNTEVFYPLGLSSEKYKLLFISGASIASERCEYILPASFRTLKITFPKIHTVEGTIHLFFLNLNFSILLFSDELGPAMNAVL
jgi:hypothetical protein